MRKAWEEVRFWEKKEVPRVSPKWGHQKEKVLKKAEGEPEKDSMGAWGEKRAGGQGRWARGEEGKEAQEMRFGSRGGRAHPGLCSADLSC